MALLKAVECLVLLLVIYCPVEESSGSDVSHVQCRGRTEVGHWPEVFLGKPGDPPVPWTDWISEFEKNLKEERCSEKAKVDLQRRFLGKEGRRVLQSLPGPTRTYEEIVSALTDHYKPSMPKTTVALLVGGAIIGGVGAVVVAPFVLTGIGFTSAGITAGSYAAAMMSSAAVANGGAVATGSTVAILQSAGVLGLSTVATTAVGAAGAAGGGLVTEVVREMLSNETQPENKP
ncbi:uncharacterized protein ACJ7VT_022049 isoform 2-T3 [Polymixia lowei]